MLVHIGYHKTASTWLQKTVFQEKCGYYQPHSMEALYAKVVKPHQFDFSEESTREFIDKGINNEKLVPVLSHERFCGDPFTGCKDSKIIADRIKSLYPEAKILIVIRNQADLITALYRTYVLQGGKASIRNFIAPPENEVNQWLSKECFEYHKIIEYYIHLFDEEKVMVATFETLKKDNIRFIDKLAEFSGAAGAYENTGERINVGLSDSSIEVLRWLNKFFSPFSDYILDINQNKVWRFCRSLVFKSDKVIRKIAGRNSFKQAVENEVSNTYHESNKITQRFITDDLNSLGYNYPDGKS